MRLDCRIRPSCGSNFLRGLRAAQVFYTRPLTSRLSGCWKIIPSFPDYEASCLGEVRRRFANDRGRRKHQALKGHERRGYRYVTLFRDGKRYSRGMHTLVCEAFHGERVPGVEACHWDGNGLNNCAANLRWGTHKENGEDMVRHGSNAGPNHWRTKLTWADVTEMRVRRDAGETLTQIAADYPASRNAVRKILKNKSWVS